MEKAIRMMRAKRMMAAADSLLQAMSSREGMHTLVDVRVDGGRMIGEGCGGPFTQEEYVEAMSLLLRLGLVPRRSRAA